MLFSVIGTALACQVPVFRYALERWKADPYRVVVIHNAPLSDSERDAINELEASMHDEETYANLEFRIVDLTEEQRPEWKQFASDQYSGERAMMFVLYPYGSYNDRPIWSGLLRSEAVAKLVSSPLRQAMLKNILEGYSATWLLVESGNKEKDDGAEQVLNQYLAAVTKELKLPEGVIGTDDAERAIKENPFLDPANILQSEIPLKISFAVVRVSRDDAREAVFLPQLLNMEDDLPDFANEPMVFPVFGRGRALPPIIGEGIGEDTIWEYAEYICGACSCEVKRDNPGIDLVFAVNWDGLIEGSQVIIDKALPPLVGVEEILQQGSKSRLENADSGDFTSAESQRGPLIKETAVERPPSTEAPGGVLATGLLLVCGGIVVAVIAGTFVALKRAA